MPFNMKLNFFQQWQDFTPLWAKVTFRQMMYYGVHLGHTVAASNSHCGWMVSGLRQGIFLIDLFKFTYQLRMGLFALEGAVRRRGPLWFVHPQKGAPAFFSESAGRCGEYSIHYPWIGGLLTNYRTVRRSLHLWLLRTDAGRRAKERRIWDANFQGSRWTFARRSWPRVLFVSSGRLGLRPCHEAQCLGVPALTITDSNTSASMVNLAIPANEASATALWFYCQLFSLFILHRKFALVNRFIVYSRRRQSRRRRLSLITGATLFASKNLWRSYSLRRILPSSSAHSASPAGHWEMHPWARTLTVLAPWSRPWNFCFRRTQSWFVKAQAASPYPPYNRYSVLKPRVQRAMVVPFGKERFFQRYLLLRGPFRSRPLWVFYQTFSSFFLSFASRWVNIYGAPFRRFFKRPPPPMPPYPKYDRRRRPNAYIRWLVGRVRRQRYHWWRLLKKARRAPMAARLRQPSLRRLRHPWAQAPHRHWNLEAQAYPNVKDSQAGQRRRAASGRAPSQISRYAARQFFAQWFVQQG